MSLWALIARSLIVVASMLFMVTQGFGQLALPAVHKPLLVSFISGPPVSGWVSTHPRDNKGRILVGAYKAPYTAPTVLPYHGYALHPFCGCSVAWWARGGLKHPWNARNRRSNPIWVRIVMGLTRIRSG